MRHVAHDHNPVPSVEPSHEQRKLCHALEDLHRWGMASFDASGSPRTKPTEMFEGALFAAQETCGENPDWIAQAAHSLREILYPFLTRNPHRTLVPEGKWQLYRSFLDKSSAGGRLMDLWIELNRFAHHRLTDVTFTRDGFSRLLAEFQDAVRDAEPEWPKMYAGLDAFIRKRPGKALPRGERE